MPYGPQIAPATVFPYADAGLGRAKKGLDWNRENYVLGALAPCVNLFSVASIADDIANTAIQAYAPLPGRTKICKIVVFCSAISAVDGTLSFNIVLGTGAYSQGSVPGNDNSSVPPVPYNVAGQTTGTGPPTPAYPPGGGGIASNPAVAGNAMFAADVPFNTTVFPNLTTGTGTGATYGQVLVPTSPDAVWPNSGILTLRVTSPADTGSITHLIIAAYLESYPLSATFPASNFPIYATPEPTVDL